MKTLKQYELEIMKEVKVVKKLKGELLRPHWCSTVRDIDGEFQEKFGEKMAIIDLTQR